MLTGFLLVVLGLVLFVWGVILTKQHPGIDKKHLYLILLGMVAISLGGVMAYGSAM